MSLYNLQERTNAILKKYEKYDAPVKTKGGKSDDPFMEEYEEVEAEVNKLTEAAAEVALEHDRAEIAAKNAEIRRAKNILLSEAIEALQKKVKKGKGVNKTVIADRQEKISILINNIYCIPDGMSSAANRRPQRYGAGKGDKGSRSNPVVLDTTNSNKSGGTHENPVYWQHTDQTQQFEKEWDMAKTRQDKKLDEIEKGVDTLGEMARQMQDEIDRQNPIIDDIEQQMDKVTAGLKTNNMKLKGLVNKMRSSRNFCVDVILISILLAIGAYIYAMFGPK